jgi:hypothetical protein
VLFNDILNGRGLRLGREGLLTTSDSDEVLHLLLGDEAALVLVQSLEEDGELILSDLGIFPQLCKDV